MKDTAMKNVRRVFVLLSILLILAGCNGQTKENLSFAPLQSNAPIASVEPYSSEQKSGETEQVINIGGIPAYFGEAYTVINNNVPFFSDDELSTESYEYYSELDALGRCGVCVASIGQDIMPTEERGQIGSVKPSGWHLVKYPGIVQGNYLYNRCHLIGFQLTGENANAKNLITGTRYMNVQGMQPFENMVADYVKETGNHVMYRVTPIFTGDNLVADGVLIEAESVEDSGNGILFHVFCYNVQPGITIDYATGDSSEGGDLVAEKEAAPVKENTLILEQTPEVLEQTPKVPGQTPEVLEQTPKVPEQTPEVLSTSEPESQPMGAYAVNSNNGKIHIVGSCPATGNGDGAMKHPVYYDTYEDAETYSVQIAPSQDKRKCGNCWK